MFICSETLELLDMDATRLNQMAIQNSEELDLQELFLRDDVDDQFRHRTAPKYTSFSIRDILGLDQPVEVVQPSSTKIHKNKVPSPLMRSSLSESSSEADGSSNDSPINSRRKSERRQAYSSYQVRELERVFTTTSYPGRKTFEHLAQLTELTLDQVRIWFQNRRQKYKTVARSGGRSWILRSAPRILRSNTRVRNLSSQPNQFVRRNVNELQTENKPTNDKCTRMPSRYVPDWSTTLGTRVPTHRVPKYHPYAACRCVQPVLCQSTADRCVTYYYR